MPIFMSSEIYIIDTKSILLNSNLSRNDAVLSLYLIKAYPESCCNILKA